MTINEIAELSGVSRATVSRYLNNGYVSEEKRERIRKVIEETGYQPSAQAQMLRSKKTSLIGVIIPKIHSESISRMVAGISEIASKSGYQIILANTFNKTEKELKYLKIFKENHVDGIILIGTIFTNEHKKMLDEIKVPIVILGQNVKGVPCVYHDDLNASHDVAVCLFQSMKERFKEGAVAYIGVSNKDKAAGQGRRNGFLQAAKENGMIEEQIYTKETEFTFDGGYRAMNELLEQKKDIRAVMCATDIIALGAMTSVRDHGMEIPDDVVFAGIGDSTTVKAIRPKLTTVHYYYKTSGIEAATLLLDMLKEKNSSKKDIKMLYELIENGTT